MQRVVTGHGQRIWQPVKDAGRTMADLIRLAVNRCTAGNHLSPHAPGDDLMPQTNPENRSLTSPEVKGLLCQNRRLRLSGCRFRPTAAPTFGSSRSSVSVPRRPGVRRPAFLRSVAATKPCRRPGRPRCPASPEANGTAWPYTRSPAERGCGPGRRHPAPGRIGPS